VVGHELTGVTRGTDTTEFSQKSVQDATMAIRSREIEYPDHD
jgi:hypothetical protein